MIIYSYTDDDLITMQYEISSPSVKYTLPNWFNIMYLLAVICVLILTRESGEDRSSEGMEMLYFLLSTIPPFFKSFFIWCETPSSLTK